jgi:signal transduction histidine kinase
VLTVGRHPGSKPLTQAAAERAGSFAAQAGIVLALADARRDTEQLTMLQDRERIARDLHDLVIQRLYATGMSLQGIVPLIARPEVSDRVNNAVDAMDETIKEIRSAIFALQAPQQVGRAGTREQVLDVLQEMTEPLGFAPSLSLVGDLGAHVPAATADQLLVALREALSNAARHAGASRVEVTVAAGRNLVLVVRDNGAGMKGTTRRSGLANLAERAALLGGTFRVGLAGETGTELRWQVPLPGASDPAE